jgi:hypothetical protein
MKISNPKPEPEVKKPRTDEDKLRDRQAWLSEMAILTLKSWNL